MNRILTIVGTKDEPLGLRKDAVTGDFEVLSKEGLVSRIAELTDSNFGYSVMICDVPENAVIDKIVTLKRVDKLLEDIHEYIADEFDDKFAGNSKVGYFTAGIKKRIETLKKELDEELTK